MKRLFISRIRPMERHKYMWKQKRNLFLTMPQMYLAAELENCSIERDTERENRDRHAASPICAVRLQCQAAGGKAWALAKKHHTKNIWRVESSKALNYAHACIAIYKCIYIYMCTYVPMNVISKIKSDSCLPARLAGTTCCWGVVKMKNK